MLQEKDKETNKKRKQPIESSSVKPLLNANKDWKLCDEVVVDTFLWMKVSLRTSEDMNDITKHGKINFPFLDKPEGEIDDGLPDLELICNLENRGMLDDYVDTTDQPAIVMKFADGTTESIKTIQFSDTFAIAGKDQSDSNVSNNTNSTGSTDDSSIPNMGGYKPVSSMIQPHPKLLEQHIVEKYCLPDLRKPQVKK